ncbi:unnamed protein product [Aphis gossypii]|uniref:Uncharacterized protein n=1 Tax=Aphis gossypii TaxID=80765 RepID=A0A9P0IJC2_APHGO|nr:unnamed protein product [Aphis gossypii]
MKKRRVVLKYDIVSFKEVCVCVYLVYINVNIYTPLYFLEEKAFTRERMRIKMYFSKCSTNILCALSVSRFCFYSRVTNLLIFIQIIVRRITAFIDFFFLIGRVLLCYRSRNIVIRVNTGYYRLSTKYR